MPPVTPPHIVLATAVEEIVAAGASFTFIITLLDVNEH